MKDGEFRHVFVLKHNFNFKQSTGSFYYKWIVLNIHQQDWACLFEWVMVLNPID